MLARKNISTGRHADGGEIESYRISQSGEIESNLREF